MKSNKQTLREAKQLFRMCLVNGLVDEDRVRLVVARVIAGKRRGYMTLLARLEHFVKVERDRHTAQIDSAMPLPPELETKVRASLQHLYGPGISIEFTHQPELIGGMRIKVGSDVYDGSVRGALAALQKSF